jgi:hypothetical protein
MALGTFTVDRDCQAVFIAPNGTRLDLAGLTDFNWTPEYKQARSDPLNAPPIERFLPAGHRLKFTIDRNGGANDALFSQIELGWWTIGSSDAGTSDSGTVFIYIQETTGAQSTYQYSGVGLKLSSGGDFKTDAPVKQTIEGFAQRFVKAS